MITKTKAENGATIITLSLFGKGVGMVVGKTKAQEDEIKRQLLECGCRIIGKEKNYVRL